MSTGVLRVEVSTSATFASRVASSDALVAAAAHDGVVKLRMRGLAPRTTYFNA